MNTVIIVLTFCMIADSSRCIKERPDLIEPLHMEDCTMAGQVLAQDYMLHHPEWRIFKWKCGPAEALPQQENL